MPIKDIPLGMPVATATGDTMVMTNEVVNEPIQVFNFSVQTTPSYFIGNEQVWVHNAECEWNGGKPDVPGRVQSRINISNEGWSHVVDRHFSGKPNASQFSISQSELKALLQSKDVVSAPIIRVIQSNDGPRYVREVDVGRNIGVDAKNGSSPASVLTVMTDGEGNLVTVFPGVVK